LSRTRRTSQVYAACPVPAWRVEARRGSTPYD
jgi:hypothetical protein